MIELTRLNGNPMIVNSDLIKYAESSPDTMLTLIHGEKIMVLETCPEVVDRIVAYRARLLGEAARMQPAFAEPALQSSLASSAAAMRAGEGAQLSSSPPDDMSDELEAAKRRRRAPR
jgi:flagellar protein FlbD